MRQPPSRVLFSRTKRTVQYPRFGPETATWLGAFFRNGAPLTSLEGACWLAAPKTKPHASAKKPDPARTRIGLFALCTLVIKGLDGHIK